MDSIMKLNRLFIFTIFLIFLSMESVCLAAVSNSNRVTFFNKITDSLATMGKSKSDKERIKKIRQENRRNIRSFNQENKNRVKTQSKIQKEQKKILNKIPKGRTTIGL